MVTFKWTCHICGDDRPDERISVHTTDVSASHDLPPGTMKMNVRYCNDRPKCVAAAPSFTFLKSKEKRGNDD